MRGFFLRIYFDDIVSFAGLLFVSEVSEELFFERDEIEFNWGEVFTITSSGGSVISGTGTLLILFRKL